MSHKKSDDVQGPMLDPSAANKNWVRVSVFHELNFGHAVDHTLQHLLITIQFVLPQLGVVCQAVLDAAASVNLSGGLVLCNWCVQLCVIHLLQDQVRLLVAGKGLPGLFWGPSTQR